MSQVILARPVRAVDGNGEPVPGALLFFTAAGTETPVTVYTDAEEQTPHPSPIVADANGIWPPVFRSGQPLRATARTPDGAILPGYPIDPVASSSIGGAARNISFEPTVALPQTNVQDAIVAAVATAATGYEAEGLGVLGDAPTLADFDATNVPTSFRRMTSTTTGLRPDGWGTAAGVVQFLRETANSGVILAIRRTVNGVAYRRLSSGVWSAWRVLAEMDSVIRAAVGSAASPSYTFTGRTGVGFSSPVANTIAVSTGGVDRLNIGNNVATSTVTLRLERQLEGGTASGLTIPSTPDSRYELRAAPFHGFDNNIRFRQTGIDTSEMRFIISDADQANRAIALRGAINGVFAEIGGNLHILTGPTIDAATLRFRILTSGGIRSEGNANWTGPMSTTGECAPFQSGSNGNGVFVRFADGTQICAHVVTESLAIATSFMGGYRSTAQTWTFPAAFVAPPVLSPPAPLNLTAFGGVSANTPTATAAQWAVTAMSSQTSAPRTVALVAFGRWV